jgi:predicted dehydrogenase
MNKKIKIAMVGCGALARIFYLPVFKKLSLTPEVIVDPDTKAISGLAQTYGVHKICNSLEEITDDIDAAIIASPNFLHFPQAKYLLERGKHVLLEKPMTVSGQEGISLIESSKNSGSVLQVAMMRRFWKINKAVKKILQDNVLGTLETISMQEGAVMNWPVQSAAVFNPQQSLGGVFIDTGSHTLDLLNWWVGDKNFSLQYEDDNHGGVEADCNLAVNFLESSVKAEIRLSRIRNMPNEFILKGTKGWVKLKPFANMFESSSRAIDKYIYNLYPVEELKRQSFEDLFSEQVKSFVSSIEKGSKPEIDAESVLPSIRMIEQAYKSRKQMNYAWR